MDHLTVRGVDFVEPARVAPSPRPSPRARPHGASGTRSSPSRASRSGRRRPPTATSRWGSKTGSPPHLGATDARQQSIVDAIGPHLESHLKLLDTWSNAPVAAGGAPPDPAERTAG